MDYFFKTTSFYGYPRGQFELLVGMYTISHTDNNTYTINPGTLFATNFTEDDIRDFVHDFPGNLIIESFDGYRSLFIPSAQKSAILIQISVRKYLKHLKWRRTGLAIMAILAPILYHPKSPYMARVFASC